MNDNGEKGPGHSFEDAMVIVQLTKALYAKNIDEIFRVLGRYMDKHRFQVSPDVIQEYEIAGRIKRT